MGLTFGDLGPTVGRDEPMPTKAETKPTPSNIRCEDLPPNATVNSNPAPFTTVWERQFPNFVEPKKYREYTVDVGRSGYRSRAIRLTLAPTNPGRVMIDAVAIVGYQAGARDGLRCKGEVWASPVVDGLRRSAHVQAASVVPVPCSGRGTCGPRGCVCHGNFYGEGCEGCRLGWTGTACDVPVRVGCRRVVFEDLSQYGSSHELRTRWRWDNARTHRTRALQWQVYGSQVRSPVYDLGDHTHVKLELGTIMVDVPRSDDCGILVCPLGVTPSAVVLVSRLLLLLLHFVDTLPLALRY